MRPIRLPPASFWRTLAASLVAAAIVHILITLLAAGLNTSSAYQRLAARLPVNRMVVLAPASPGTQLLPFQTPDVRMAVCRFDASDGPVTLRAALPEAAWTLSLYAPTGEAFYAMSGQEQRRITVGLVLVPPGDRFTAATTGASASSAAEVPLPVRAGLAIIRAPTNGRAFGPFLERDITAASCAGTRS
jgi:uncharacterized membrane protein